LLQGPTKGADTEEEAMQRVTTSWAIAFNAITDVIHRLLELITHVVPRGLPFD
jgi:hypothetical protein